MDAIKETCQNVLDTAIRRRLNEIHWELRQIQRNIKKLQLMVSSQSRRGSMAEGAEGDMKSEKKGGKKGEKKNAGTEEEEDSYEAKLKAEEEEETKRAAEEDQLTEDLKMVSSLQKVDIAELGGACLKLRGLGDEYAYTKVAATKTYRLVKVDEGKEGEGDIETPIDVNI